MLSYQSLMPAAAGAPRFENWVHWLMEGSGVVCAPHPTPGWGQALALGLSLFGRRWLVSPASRIGVRDFRTMVLGAWLHFSCDQWVEPGDQAGVRA